MRHHYEKPAIYSSIYGVNYACDHPIYDECTLYFINKKKGGDDLGRNETEVVYKIYEESSC